MERQIPKNVRQIGNVSDTPKVYVEDYVDTFFAQLAEKYEQDESEEKSPLGAFLIGEMQRNANEDYVYIYGAIKIHDLKKSGNEYVLDDATWKRAYEECKEFFEDGEIVGWFMVQSGVPMEPDRSLIKLHKKSFPKKNTIFVMRDSQEKEEIYYVHKMNDLMEIGGHYTYYEKNPCMQNYMIASRKKNGAVATESVEDKAAQNFRNLARERGQHRRRRPGKTGGMIYAVSTGLVLILIIMGVSMLNNFDKMKSVQSRLQNLTGATQETGNTVNTVTSDQTAKAETQDQSSAESETEIQHTTQEEAGHPGAEQTETGENQSAGEETEGAGDEENSSDTVNDSGAAKSEETEPVQEASASVKAADTNTTETISDTNGSDGVYVVEKGDTLAIISRKMYGDINHVDAICRMNGLNDGNLIYIGQKLLLP